MEFNTQLTSYSEVREKLRTHVLRQTEVPTEHAVSLPMPTKRWANPGYACFASPALRLPGQPMQQGAPDRWWVLDAAGNSVMVYAWWKAVPFTEGVTWSTVTLPKMTVSIAELRTMLAGIEEIMDALIPDFFADQAGDPRIRQQLIEALHSYLPGVLMPQYQALAPDYFAWLEK